MTRKIMTLAEVSERTHVPVNTLRYYRTERRGPRLWRLGGRLVAYEDDVQTWLDEQYAADRTSA